jgi:hypothetical protein
MAKPFTKNDPRINRRGRPKKGTALTEILSMRLDQKDASGVLKRQAIADALIEQALLGDVHALKFVFDRIDGKIPEKAGQTRDAPAYTGAADYSKLTDGQLEEIIRNSGG